jgi:hypothetical protein
VSKKEIRSKLFAYEGKIWARTLLLVLLICLGWQLYELDADVSRRGDVFGTTDFSAIGSDSIPSADNTYSLGSSSYEWKNIYVDSTANIDSLVADTADINGGTIDGVTIGTNSACTDLRVDNLQLNGNTLSSTNTNGNLTFLPNGSGITVAGDAGTTSHSLAANDDLFVTGKLEVDGAAYFDGSIQAANISVNIGGSGGLVFNGSYGSSCSYLRTTEEVTIPVGSGLDPVVVSTSNMAPASSIIEMVTVRVTQAPGGGATTLDVGRTGGNTDEFIDGIATSLGTTGNCVDDGDGTLTGPVFNSTAATLTLTTDADVTGTAMKVRIVVWYRQVTEPTS